MDTKYQIRLASQQDQQQLLELIRAHAEFEGGQVAEYGGDDSRTEPLADLASMPVTIFVVEDEKALQGYFSVIKQYSTWDRQWYLYLDCLYLTSEYRGQGIGQQLMEFLKGYAKIQGIELIQWQTPSDNKAAIAFYQKLGAQTKCKQRFFWPLDSQSLC